MPHTLSFRAPDAPRPKIRQFIYRRIYSFRGVATPDGTTASLLAIIRNIPRHTDLKPVWLSIFFGLFDDPASEVPEVYLDAVDPGNLPTLVGLRESCSWIGMQAWRSIGTDAGPVNTMSRDSLMIVDPLSGEAPIYSNRGNRTINYALCVLASSDVSSNIIAAGSVMVEITIDRRIWPGPDWPKDMEWEDWAGGSD